MREQLFVLQQKNSEEQTSLHFLLAEEISFLIFPFPSSSRPPQFPQKVAGFWLSLFFSLFRGRLLLSPLMVAREKRREGEEEAFFFFPAKPTAVPLFPSLPS